MNSPTYKIIGIIALIITFTVSMTACDTGSTSNGSNGGHDSAEVLFETTQIDLDEEVPDSIEGEIIWDDADYIDEIIIGDEIKLDEDYYEVVNDDSLKIDLPGAEELATMNEIEIRAVFDNGDTSTTTIEIVGEVELGKIEMIDADDDFHWPYFLYIPAEVRDDAHILVVTNNQPETGQEPEYYQEETENDIERKGSMLAEDLEVPLLMPAFPRPEHMYTHALDAVTLEEGEDYDEHGEGYYKRIDNQLLAMADHAKEHLEDEAHNLKDEILMWGYSASGSFANNMVAIHPEEIKAAAVGHAGGWPIAPVEEWEDDNLKYDLGVANLEDLIDINFEDENKDSFQDTPQFIFVGEDDNDHDMPQVDDLDESKFGDSIDERWESVQEIYDEKGVDAAEFKVYDNVGHEFTDDMLEDSIEFLEEAMNK